MLTGLEEEDNPARYFHRAAGAWVLAEACAAVFDQESAKALDLDAIFRVSAVPIDVKMASTTRSTSLSWR